MIMEVYQECSNCAWGLIIVNLHQDGCANSRVKTKKYVHIVFFNLSLPAISEGITNRNRSSKYSLYIRLSASTNAKSKLQGQTNKLKKDSSHK